MFAPDGFLSLSQVVAAAFAAAKDYRHDHLRSIGKDEWKYNSESAAQAGQIASYREKNTEIELVAAWIAAKTMAENTVYICSPQGTMLTANGLLLAHEDRLEWYARVLPVHAHLEDMDELTTVLTQRINGTPGALSPLDRFRFLDTGTGTISTVERGAELERFAEESGENLTNQVNVASQFENWSVCFKQADIENITYTANRKAEQLNWGSKIADERQLIEPNKGGRPRKCDEVVNAYFEVMGGAHTGTWEEAARELREITRLQFAAGSLSKWVNSAKTKRTTGKNPE